jgi:hypothetical protein
MKSGDILGHEFMGEVIETGSAHTKFRKGDRIVVPFNINCGECRQCKLGNYSVCQRSNRNAAMAAEQFGYTTAGLFGYSHLTGGYAGGQAEYVRVPMADVAPMKVPDGMTDEEVLFLTDIFPHRLSGRRAGRHQGWRNRGDLGARVRCGRAAWSRFPASTEALSQSTWARSCRKVSGCAAPDPREALSRASDYSSKRRRSTPPFSSPTAAPISLTVLTFIRPSKRRRTAA